MSDTNEQSGQQQEQKRFPLQIPGDQPYYLLPQSVGDELLSYIESSTGHVKTATRLIAFLKSMQPIGPPPQEQPPSGSNGS